MQKNSESNERSKQRRIHDITKILSALELIDYYQEHKQNFLVYKDIEDFIDFL